MANNKKLGKTNISLFTAISVAIIIALVLLLNGVKNIVIQSIRYSDAIELFESGEYDAAMAAFEHLGDYRNSVVKTKECRYLLAIQYEECGKYHEAIELFELLDEYRDVSVHIEQCNYALAKKYTYNQEYDLALMYLSQSGYLANAEELVILAILNSDLGDSVEFGSYEQDNDITNGAEPIKWTVIGTDDDTVTLLSNKNLECIKYNETWANVTWENCTLRDWLNNNFLTAAFNENESKVLTSYYVTGDPVYILSADEWTQYGINGGTVNTDYAIARGVYNESGRGWTWLRDSGIGKDHAQEIDCEGNINSFGSFVDCDNDGVRPVIIICGGNLYG